MISYQDILGKTKAATFAESLNTLVGHLELRQKELAVALQKTSSTIEALKQLDSKNGGPSLESLTQLDLSSITNGTAAVEEEEDEEEEEEEEEVVEAPRRGRKKAVKAAPAKVVEPEPKRRGRGPGKAKAAVSAAKTKTTKEAPKRARGASRAGLLKEFQDKTLRDSILMVLTRRKGEAVSIEEILQALYGRTVPRDVIKAAKPTIAAELSRGKANGLWIAVPDQAGRYSVPN
jgi:hypothetical protein